MLETLLGKVLGWIPAPWSGVRLGHEVSAHLCTDGHPVAWVVGGIEQPWPRGPRHIDVWLRLWSRTEHRTTVRGVEAYAAGQTLHPYHFVAGLRHAWRTLELRRLILVPSSLSLTKGCTANLRSSE